MKQQDKEMWKAISVFFGMVLLMVTFQMALASASIDNLGTFKQGSTITLLQVCDCTYNNVSVISPNSTTLISNAIMAKIGDQFQYNLSGAYTQSLGRYIVNGKGDDGGSVGFWSYTFDVTPTGSSIDSGFSSFTIMIIILVIISLIMIVGFVKEDYNMLIFGSIVGFLLGLYILLNGFGDFRTEVTTGIGFLIICVSGYIAVRAGIESIG